MALRLESITKVVLREKRSQLNAAAVRSIFNRHSLRKRLSLPPIETQPAATTHLALCKALAPTQAKAVDIIRTNLLAKKVPLATSVVVRETEITAENAGQIYQRSDFYDYTTDSMFSFVVDILRDNPFFCHRLGIDRSRLFNPSRSEQEIYLIDLLEQGLKHKVFTPEEEPIVYETYWYLNIFPTKGSGPNMEAVQRTLEFEAHKDSLDDWGKFLARVIYRVSDRGVNANLGFIFQKLTDTLTPEQIAQTVFSGLSIFDLTKSEVISSMNVIGVLIFTTLKGLNHDKRLAYLHELKALSED